jgi:4'-phosphopantetheinyl transferase EntD
VTRSFADILPSRVIVECRDGDVADTSLYPAECELISRAVGKRKREFATGRACAHKALQRLGICAGPLLSDARGAPLWPDGVAGSITHCAGFRAAAVARQTDFVSLGIDAEPNAELPRQLVGDIALPQEVRWLRELAGDRLDVNFDRLLFCIKEAIYKAWYPITHRWLGFEDVSVELALRSQEFRANLLIAPPVVEGRDLREFRGRWLATDRLVGAAVLIEPPALS